MEFAKKSRIPTRVQCNNEKCKYLDKENVGKVRVLEVTGSISHTKATKTNLNVPIHRHRILSDTALLPPKKKVKILVPRVTADKVNRPPLGELDKNTVKKNVVGTKVQKNVRIVKTVAFKNVDTATAHVQKRVEEKTETKRVITNTGNGYETNIYQSKLTQLTNYEIVKPTSSSNNKPTTSNQDSIPKTPILVVDKNVFRKSLTPHPKSFDDSYLEKMIIDPSENFITFKQSVHRGRASDQINLKNGEYISPIKPNLYTKKSTVISQGIPEEVRRPAKKLSLIHKIHPGSNKQKNSTAYCLDIYSTEYLDDIIRCQLQEDWKYVLKMNYIEYNNPYIMQNRAAVVNWLIKTQDYLNLSPTVLFTTIRLFDRALENISIACNMCQLVGLVTMWIVQKFEDSENNLTASKMLTLCNGAYSKRDFTKTEKKLLKFFNFELKIPDVTIYVVYYMRRLRLECDILLYSAFYILECYTLNIKFSTVTPSMQAAAAVRVASKILNPSTEEWNLQFKDTTLGYYTDKKLQGLMKEMLQQLHITQDPAYEYREPYHKYSTKDKVQVSIVLLRNLIAT